MCNVIYTCCEEMILKGKKKKDRCGGDCRKEKKVQRSLKLVQIGVVQ